MIISNHLIGKMPIPEDAIIRVNLAWIKTYEEAEKIISDSVYDIYLDYPSGRTKPPKPKLNLDDAIKLSRLPKVKYFAASNTESIDIVVMLLLIMKDKEFIPKIETEAGVNNLPQMIKKGIKTVMLDADDLWVDVGADVDKFDMLKERVLESGIKVLTLQGVCFE